MKPENAMNKRHQLWAGLLLCGLLTGAAPPEARAEDKVIYENNFEKAALDKEPDGFLILDGGFTVRQEDGNKFLELPGAPLSDTGMGALFGPSRESGIVVTARFFGTRKGRRFPTFGPGVNGQAGFRLQVSPAKDALEIYQGDQIVATKEFKWTSGQWHTLKIQIKPEGSGVKVEGKAWLSKEAEPKEWQVTASDPRKPPAGKASIWGAPYSGTPIRFDDIKVAEAP
jgi:hypothetical protein